MQPAIIANPRTETSAAAWLGGEAHHVKQIRPDPQRLHRVEHTLRHDGERCDLPERRALQNVPGAFELGDDVGLMMGVALFRREKQDRGRDESTVNTPSPAHTLRQVANESSDASGDPTTTPPSPPIAIVKPLTSGSRATGKYCAEALNAALRHTDTPTPISEPPRHHSGEPVRYAEHPDAKRREQQACRP